MGTFQSTVRRYQAAGIVGELAYHGPTRVTPGEIAEANIDEAYIGRFYTKNAETGEYSPGGEIDNVDVLFGGIACNPKELVSFGNSSQGPLGPTLKIAGNQVVSFLEMGWVWLSVDDGENVRQGMKLAYSTTTGAIQLVSGDTTDGGDGGSGSGNGGATQQGAADDDSEFVSRALPDGFKLVPNAIVWRTPGPEETDGGMYVAKLTN